MTDVQLTFRNESNDTNNSEFVIFQKDAHPSLGQLSIAWRVIKNCGQNDYHPFTYPMTWDAAAVDSWGNHTQILNAKPGECFEMVKNDTGDVLLESKSPSSNPSEIEILNNLSTGAITAQIFKGGNLFAQKTGLAPQEKAVFEFHPVIYVGAVSEVDEGQAMDSAVMSSINTKFDLTSITSADIVVRGGGSGPNATPFQFEMQNIQYTA